MSFDDALISANAGLDLVKPLVNVFPLYLMPTGSGNAWRQGTYNADGSDLVMQGAGSTVMYDPAGSLYPITVEASFDERLTYITLPPGVVLDLRPAKFNRIHLRWTQAYPTGNLTVPTFYGKIYTSPLLAGNIAGALPWTPIYTRPPPSVTTSSVATLSGTGYGSGIFTWFNTLISLPVDAYQVVAKLRNIAQNTIWVTTNTALPPTAATLFPLPAGETLDIIIGSKRSSPFNVALAAQNGLVGWSDEQNAQVALLSTVLY